MTDTIRVDAHLTVPQDDGYGLTMRQAIHAHPTSTPGLVVFPLILSPIDVDPDWWNVTHIASGKRLPGTFRHREDATNYATAAAELADWTQDRPATTGVRCMALAAHHGGLTDNDHIDAMRRDNTAGGTQ